MNGSAGAIRGQEKGGMASSRQHGQSERAAMRSGHKFQSSGGSTR
jgi:hypothetical protein